MPMRMAAKLGSLTLPQHFSYKPYVPRKRISTTATATAVVVQAASPVIVHGDSILAWTMPGSYPSEFQALWNIYKASTNTLLTFEGYWGETLSVYFTTLDAPTVRGRLFDLSGQFQVISVTNDYSAGCGLV